MILFMSPAYVLIGMAVVPAVVLMSYVYKADRLEKESAGMIRSLVLLGIISTSIACLLEIVGEYILGLFYSENQLIYQVILYFVIVGIAEEGAKFTLLYWRTWRSKEFNCQFDGVVYAVFVSLGFALWENIRYVLSYGFATALIRAITAIPGHACFGVFMGVWYGLAKRFEGLRDQNARNVCLTLSLVFPVLTHGLYDFIATMEAENHEWIFFLYIIILFFVSFRLVQKMSRTDKYIPVR